MARALGCSLTQMNMATDEPVPASNPQKPPAAVILFHSIPRITVPNSGAIKKAEQRLNVIHDASELRHHWKG